MNTARDSGSKDTDLTADLAGVVGGEQPQEARIQSPCPEFSLLDLLGQWVDSVILQIEP